MPRSKPRLADGERAAEMRLRLLVVPLRDQRMREQAHVIQEEVAKLMEDVGRLDDRVKKLQLHFGQANKDVEDILVSTRKISGGGKRIESVEFHGTGPVAAKTADTPEIEKRPVRPTTPSSRDNGPPELPFSQFEEV